MPSLRAAEIWNHYPEAFRPAAEPVPVGGGLSAASVWRCECPAGAFALKRQEHALHHEAQLRAAALPFVPKLVLNRAGDTAKWLGGAWWELAEWRPGAPADDPWTVVDAAAAGLAAWHQAFDGNVPKLPRDRLGTAAAQRAEQWARLAPVAYAADAFGRALRTLAPRMPEWLARCAAAPPLALCHGDPNRGNLLFQDGTLTGLLDFAALRLDTPLLDLARWCGDAAPCDDAFRRATLAAYARHAPLAADAEAVAVALEATGTVLAALRWQARLRQPFAAPAERDAAAARWDIMAARVGRWAVREG